MLVRSVALLLGLRTAAANVYTYTDTPLQPDVIEYRRVGMWSPADMPTHKRGGNDESSVSMDLTFNRVDARRPGLIQVAFFNAEELPRIGAQLAAGAATRRAFCCTSALLHKVPGCEAAGQLIVAPPSAVEASAESGRRHHHEVSVHDIAFAANQSLAGVSQRTLIKQSGVHYLLLSSCEPHTGVVRFSGRTEWRNPHGYLPGELYPFLPFFGMLTIAYMLLASGWALLCFRHWSQLLPLQSAIAGVLLLAMIEAATWWRCYHAFNEEGTRGLLPTILGVLVSTIRKTVSRGLVLTVCLGYGVVRPTIGSVWPRILTLGAVYFVASATLDIVSNVGRLEEHSLPTRLVLVLPVSLLDAFYFWWCCSAVSGTLSQLSSRRQSAKLLLYRRFSHVLLGLICASGLWISWQMLFIVTDTLDARWAFLWTFDAGWHVLYFGMLATICMLWSPSKNNLQYAYMDELAHEDPGEEVGDHEEDGSMSADAAVTPYKRGA